MNYTTSFGFSEKWRKQCVDGINIQNEKTVVDLMTGMGECWKHVFKKNNSNLTLIGLDFSSEMINKAEKNKSKFKHHNINLLKENVFDNSIKDQTADYVISAFGLKTFNHTQLENLALEIHRILKPNGTFSLIEVSVPNNIFLRKIYMFYLKNIIPIFGKFFLKNPETYKMLGTYTQEFTNSRNVCQIFEQHNFKVEYIEYFYGCASGIKGIKFS